MSNHKTIQSSTPDGDALNKAYGALAVKLGVPFGHTSSNLEVLKAAMAARGKNVGHVTSPQMLLSLLILDYVSVLP